MIALLVGYINGLASQRNVRAPASVQIWWPIQNAEVYRFVLRRFVSGKLRTDEARHQPNGQVYQIVLALLRHDSGF